jgi:predicted TIM-barrel fold metal-dependent hydrolase
MTAFSRRGWLGGFAAASLGWASGPRPVSAQPGRGQESGSGGGQEPERERLALEDYEPRSMLRVRETSVPRARFPVVDAHTHLTFVEREPGEPGPGTLEVLAPPEALLPVMDRKNVKLMVNLTGGSGEALETAVATFDRAHPGRFATCTEPSYQLAGEAGYAQRQADAIAEAVRIGARGLKVLKTLGLYLRDGGPGGPLVAIDDPRFDPMWDACGALGLPVFIHVADPAAFFLPTDRFNERYEELSNHPDWSFHGRDFPSRRELLEARNRVVGRHPRTRFVGLHFGNNPEDLADVGETLDRHPNLSVEIGARIGELGRQPRTAQRFFERYQDRILFGTDAVPGGDDTPQQVFGGELYDIYFRFLETQDEYFDYAPAPVPPQGRWKIYGLGLAEPALKKLYHDNAAALLGLGP